MTNSGITSHYVDFDYNVSMYLYHLVVFNSGITYTLTMISISYIKSNVKTALAKSQSEFHELPIQNIVGVLTNRLVNKSLTCDTEIFHEYLTYFKYLSIKHNKIICLSTGDTPAVGGGYNFIKFGFYRQ